MSYLGTVLFLDCILIRSRQEVRNGRFKKNQYCTRSLFTIKSISVVFLRVNNRQGNMITFDRKIKINNDDNNIDNYNNK